MNSDSTEEVGTEIEIAKEAAIAQYAELYDNELWLIMVATLRDKLPDGQVDYVGGLVTDAGLKICGYPGKADDIWINIIVQSVTMHPLAVNTMVQFLQPFITFQTRDYLPF